MQGGDKQRGAENTGGGGQRLKGGGRQDLTAVGINKEAKMGKEIGAEDGKGNFCQDKRKGKEG